LIYKTTASRDEKGFSLLEIMVVIAIAAGMTGLVVSMMGASFQSQAKKEISRLISNINFAYNQAIIRGVSLRLVFDLTNQKYWLEEGSEVSLVSIENENDIENKRDKKDLDKRKEEKEKQKEEETSLFDEESDTKIEKIDESKNITLEAQYSLSDEMVKTVTFDKEVRIRDVFVAHQKEPLVQELAYLYFFPRGLTEKAVIHFSNEEDTSHYTVIVNPVTGRCRVETEDIEYDKVDE